MARAFLLTLLLTLTLNAQASDRVLLSTADRDARYVVIQTSDAIKLYAVPKDGGSRTLLATKLGTPRKLYVDETFVYWTSERGTERVTKDGWEREVVAVNTASR
jgi:hypothetical protein